MSQMPGVIDIALHSRFKEIENNMVPLLALLIGIDNCGCDQCDHMRQLMDDGMKRITSPDAIDQDATIGCSICRKRFTSSEKYIRHMKNRHDQQYMEDAEVLKLPGFE
jgi:hypothetical protein